MSELIDKIFDAKKISAEINTILSELTRATAGINTYKDAVLALEAATRKSKGNEELIKNSKLLNDTVISGGKEMKRYEAEVQKLKEKTEQLTVSEKAAAIEIAKARLELAAANKGTKEAAIAEIELAANNGKLITSYNSLAKEMKEATAELKAMDVAELKSAKGLELAAKIKALNDQLKETDESMGNYQRNVGNYSSAFEGLGGVVSGLPGALGKMGGAVEGATVGFQALNTASPVGWITILINILTSLFGKLQGNQEMALGLSKAMGFLNGVFSFFTKIVIDGTKGVISFFTNLKSFPELLKKVGDGIKENLLNRLESFSVMGKAIVKILNGDIKEGFKDLGNGYLQAVTGVENLGDKTVDAFGKVKKAITDATSGGAKLAELEKLFETQERNSKKLQLQYQLEAEKLRQIRDDEALTVEQRMKANQDLGAVLKKQVADESQVANTQLKIAKLKIKQDGETKDNLDLLAEAETRLIDIKERITGQESEQLANLNGLRRDSVAKQKEYDKQILESKRRLIDSQLAIMENGEKKDIDISNEAFNRKIEDLKNSNQLTKELLKNLTIEQQNEVAKIKEDYRLTDIEKEKKRIEDIQKSIEKQTADLSFEYTKQETDLKKQYANGLINEQEYQNQLAKLKLDSLLDVNDKTIASLEQLLTDSKLTDDKRAELSNKLAQLQIDNENAVLDATIKNNEDKVKSDEEAIAQRIAVTEALGQATMEIFSSIADFATQQSTQRVEELEAEQEASDTSFETAQTNLDNALMSDENRAAKQQELNDKKAASDKALADKLQAEKIKQAKWDKANGIVQAIITSGLAILKASLMTPFIPLGLIAAGLAGTMGAAQIATIASAQIPAYEKGTDNHPGGLSLWGEKRPEVAVLPSGETFLAEKPTITEFDSGTKIYKSVSDYESYLANQTMKQFAFDYDKMAGKIPKQSIVLDSRGLWGVISQQNSRRTMINRRYYS